MRRYTVLITPEPNDGAYTVTVPALPGCVSCGDTIDEAIENIREAITLYVQSLEARGLPIPDDVPAAPRVERVEV